MSVAVRILRLDLREDALRRCDAVLDEGERARAEQISDKAARRRFAAARSLLRVSLAGVLGCAPQALVIASGPFGKPYLSENGEPHPLKFSLAHAGNFLALAWSYAGEVGIDVEIPRPRLARDLDGLIAHVLNDAEGKRLRRLAPAAREAAFYRLWTRKEALAKAAGTGFSVAPAAIAARKGRSWRGFTVRDLALPAGVFGALASR